MSVMVSNNGERGASVIEFTLVLPILLMLLFGAIEFGFIFYNQAMLTNACREGARAGIVLQLDGTRLTDTEIEEIVVNYLTRDGKLILLNFDDSTDADLEVDVTPPDLPDLPAFPNDLKVEVTYPYKFLFVPSFMPLIPQSLPLSARVIMKYE
ncbi:MAG: TadE/TadG family type IV pilus assembly protein [Spirochaetales bacterium]|nr:TadE/TadG family type IV pilus assembly protein [Spirochaetales bacterium]